MKGFPTKFQQPEETQVNINWEGREGFWVLVFYHR